MKNKTLILLLSLLSISAFAQTVTYTQVAFTKNSQDKNGLNYIASPLEKWCAGANGFVQFSSFEAAQYVEKLADGFYVCDGKFVNVKFQSAVQFFDGPTCTLQNAADLKASCK